MSSPGDYVNLVKVVYDRFWICAVFKKTMREIPGRGHPRPAMRSTRDNRLLSALSRLNQGTMSSEPTVMSPEDDEQAYLAKTNTQLNAQRLAQDAGVSHQHSTGRLKPALRSQHSREQGARDPALVSALSRMQEKHSERGLLEFRDHPLVAEPLSQLSSAGAADPPWTISQHIENLMPSRPHILHPGDRDRQPHTLQEQLPLVPRSPDRVRLNDPNRAEEHRVAYHHGHGGVEQHPTTPRRDAEGYTRINHHSETLMGERLLQPWRTAAPSQDRGRAARAPGVSADAGQKPGHAASKCGIGVQLVLYSSCACLCV